MGMESYNLPQMMFTEDTGKMVLGMDLYVIGLYRKAAYCCLLGENFVLQW